MKQILIQNKNAIVYKFKKENNIYFIVTRLNFNKIGKRKSMYFETFEQAKQRFLNINS